MVIVKFPPFPLAAPVPSPAGPGATVVNKPLGPAGRPPSTVIVSALTLRLPAFPPGLPPLPTPKVDAAICAPAVSES